MVPGRLPRRLRDAWIHDTVFVQSISRRQSRVLNFLETNFVDTRVCGTFWLDCVKRDLLADGLSGVWAMWCQDGFASIARMGRQGLWFPVWRVVGNANGRLDVWACGRRSLGRVVARAFGVVNAMFTRWSFHGGVWRGARGKGPLIQFAFRILDFPVSQLIFPPHYPTPLVYTLAWSSRNAFWVARV